MSRFLLHIKNGEICLSNTEHTPLKIEEVVHSYNNMVQNRRDVQAEQRKQDRKLFAAHALQGLLAHQGTHHRVNEYEDQLPYRIATAVRCADALIAELDKEG